MTLPRISALSTIISLYSGFSGFNTILSSDLYKDYAKEYDTFIRKNPGYEDKIAGKLN